MDKKELIKETALELFRQSGQITIREISKESGVNVASINYYFGSKDNLLTELEKLLIDEIKTILDKIINNSDTVSERRENFINEVYKFVKNSPGFLKFIVTLFTSQAHYDRLVIMARIFADHNLKNFIGNMIRESAAIDDEEEINNRATIFYTSLTVSVITAQAINHPNDEGSFMITRFMDKEPFASYCNTLFDIILKP